MGRTCEICKKGVRTGNRIVRHGLKKNKGGIGLHTTGVSKRRFLPNVHKIRVVENRGVVTQNVSLHVDKPYVILAQDVVTLQAGERKEVDFFVSPPFGYRPTAEGKFASPQGVERVGRSTWPVQRHR